jgi:hypothetical protein
MEQPIEIIVRRARPPDAAQIAAFVNRRQGCAITPEEIIARFGTVGFLLADDSGRLVGLLGWHAENLVVCVTDFLVTPARDLPVIGPTLLEAMEGAARELQCEAAILFIPPRLLEGTEIFWNAHDYWLRKVAEMPRAWREAVLEANLGERALLKQLRTDRVMKPI